MRWCKAVKPRESWTLISQPVWRRCMLNLATNRLEESWESDTSEHVEQWDKRQFFNSKSSVLRSKVSFKHFLDKPPPSRQNSNKGLADVLRSMPYNSLNNSGCRSTSVQILELSSQEWTQLGKVHQSLCLWLPWCPCRLKALGFWPVRPWPRRRGHLPMATGRLSTSVAVGIVCPLQNLR